MPYTQIFQDLYSRADAVKGAVGNGSVDQLSAFGITSGQVYCNDASPLSGTDTALFYNDAGIRCVNSRVAAVLPSFNSPFVASRVTGTTSMTNCYGAFVYEGSVVYFRKMVGGSSSTINTAALTGNYRFGNYVLTLDTLQEDDQTRLIVRIWSADGSTELESKELVDATPELQNLSGGYAVGCFNGATYVDALTAFEYTSGGPFTSPPVVSRVKVFRQEVQLLSTAPAGGTPAVGYQWYRSTASGTLGTALTGKTSLSLTDTTAAAGTDYWYALRATDSVALTIDSEQFAVSTVKAANSFGYVAAYEGDSITFGMAWTPYPAVQACSDLLQIAGVSFEYLNFGLPGDITPNTAPSRSEYADYGVNVLSLMWGMNDCYVNAGTANSAGTNGPLTKAQYKSRMIAYIASMLSTYPLLEKIILNHRTYTNIGSNDSTISAAQANANLRLYDEADIEIVAADETGKLFIGDTQAPAYFAAHSGEIEVQHPGQTGHLHLGQFWASAAEAILPTAALAAGELSGPTAAGATSVSGGAWTATTGGTGTKTAQFQRSANGTTGWADVAGSPTTNAATGAGDSGLTASTTYYFSVLWTDAASATVRSNVVSATTTAGGGGNIVTGITVAPTAKTLYPEGAVRIVPTVAGTGSFDTTAAFSKVVSGNPLTLYAQQDGSCIVQANAGAAAGSYQVKATANGDNTKTAICTITVQALPSGGGGERPTWLPGQVDFAFTIVESCRRLDVDGDEPLLIKVVPSMIDGTYLPITDFDAELSVVASGSNVWQAASWAPGARAALQVTGPDAGTPLTRGSYIVSIRIKNAAGAILRSDRLGILDVS